MLAQAHAVTVLPAEDLARAKKFYSETLGLRELESGIPGHALFEAGGGTRVLVYERGRSKADHTALEFIVEDVEATVKGLIEKGLTFEQYDFDGLKTNELGIAELGGRLSAWLIDPDGNILSISN
jgi:catechol 2,3-dioxygenase-like lactoylglutathione lyase family enzyme